MAAAARLINTASDVICIPAITDVSFTFDRTSSISGIRSSTAPSGSFIEHPNISSSPTSNDADGRAMLKPAGGSSSGQARAALGTFGGRKSTTHSSTARERTTRLLAVELPIVGSLHLLGNQPHRSLARLSKIYGPLMSLRMGSVTTVVVSSPEVAREFLQRHDAVFTNRSVPDATGNHSRNSVAWLPNEPRWRALRKSMGTELFSPHRLDALQHLRRDKVQELVHHVGRLASNGEAVNVGRVAFITSLNLVSRTIFSRDMTSLDDHGGSKEFQELVVGIMEAVGSPNLSDFFPALAGADLQGWRRRLARLFARQHRIFDTEIDGRLRGRETGEPRKNDFLDLLLDVAAKDDNTAGLDRDTLRSMFTDVKLSYTEADLHLVCPCLYIQTLS
ncbi:geraniol 8-hydroxylase-like [Phragmites australis]|uniref:geraniol 8-hydroxylase-like n=1 Tax=Phragmites australis TaxID=29695 RepID=UPI002D795671|nr:geraniol 8-hydroxylase-like [Phragmites australis]